MSKVLGWVVVGVKPIRACRPPSPPTTRRAQRCFGRRLLRSTPGAPLRWFHRLRRGLGPRWRLAFKLALWHWLQGCFKESSAWAEAQFSATGWTRQAVGQQRNNNTPAPYVLEVRRAVAQLLLVNRAGRELLHLSMRFPNPPTERDGPSQLLSHDDPLWQPGHRRRSLRVNWRMERRSLRLSLLPRKNATCYWNVTILLQGAQYSLRVLGKARSRRFQGKQACFTAAAATCKTPNKYPGEPSNTQSTPNDLRVETLNQSRKYAALHNNPQPHDTHQINTPNTTRHVPKQASHAAEGHAHAPQKNVP